LFLIVYTILYIQIYGHNIKIQNYFLTIFKVFDSRLESYKIVWEKFIKKGISD
jgi:hypothetical protein